MTEINRGESDLEDFMRDYGRPHRCPECGSEWGLFALHADDCPYNDEERDG